MSSGSGGLGGSGSGAGSGAAPSGTWVRQLPGEGNGSAYALSSDANDNVLALVAIDDDGSGALPSSMLVKFDRNGGMLGSTLVSGYFPYRLAVRPNGDVIVAGVHQQTDDHGQATDDVIVAGYDPDGNERFRVTLGSDSQDASNALNLDARGHIFLLWNGIPGDGTNRVLTELDENGAMLSTAVIGGSEPLFSTYVDRQGNVFVLIATSDGYAVRKYDSTGSVRWQSPVDVTPGGLSAGDDGSVRVVGTLGATQNAVTKLDQDGNALFEVAFGDTNELASLVVGDALGRTFTASTTEDFDDRSVHLIARLFDDDGTLLNDYTVVTSSLVWPVAIAIDSKGALLVGGRTDGTPPGQPHEGASDAFIARVEP